ncbi:hypothetical protein [Sediminicoccus sp. KRV36]|uniref:hypothetical protein n=1 Tax=Sediminicoccus sp. KRV36 TaxID=3133721 RepID=UPI00200CF6C9|nr:hypothetical protein [Sediminicoccus rosea]UPY37169.1 hypothetical protein LHU95_00300 [Sediminicoccus rosea]
MFRCDDGAVRHGPGAVQARTPRPCRPGGTPALSLRNGTPNIINNVYISPSSQQNWGEDRLGATETLRAGATRAFSLPVGECLYDVRIVYQGNVAEERRRIDACAEQSLALPLAAQRVGR